MNVRPVLLLALLACEEEVDRPTATIDGTEHTGCATGAEGSLRVEIPDLDLDEALTVLLIDAEGGETLVTGTTELGGLPTGEATLVIRRGIRYDPLAATDHAYGALRDTVVTVCVGEDGGSTTIEAAEQPSGRHLWVTAGESIAGFAEAALAATGAVSPDVRLDVPLVNDFRGLAFDPMGNLWAAASPTYGARLLMFRPDQLTGSGEATAALEITMGRFTEEHASVEDLWIGEDGSVWAVVGFSDTSWGGLLGWSRADLLEAIRTGGTADLAPTWAHERPELLHARDLEVVGDDAFVAVEDSNRVFRYALADLPSGPAPEAEIRFVDDLGTELRGPTDLTSSNGELWVTLWTSAALVPFSPTADGDVLASGASVGVTDLPYGMDADALGQIWWGNLDLGTTELHRFDGATRAPGPTLTAEGLDSPRDLLFDPQPR